MATNTTKTSKSSNKTSRASTSRKKSTNTASDAGTVGQVAKGIGFLSILEALVLGVLGVIMILHPDTVTKAIFYVVGIFLMVKGIYKIINFFAMHSKTDFYNNDLLYGVIALVFGVLIVVLYERLKDVIGIIVGVWIIYSALVRMNTSIKMHAAGLKQWFYVFLLAAIMLALGIYAIINFDIIPATVGWVLVAAAIVSVIDDSIFLFRVNEVVKE